MSEWVKVLLPLVATVVISIIGYFVKRSFSRIDGLHNELVQLRQDTVRREEYDKAIDELRDDVKDIRDNYIKRDDFYREISKLDRKLDAIMDKVIVMMRRWQDEQ